MSKWKIETEKFEDKTPLGRVKKNDTDITRERKSQRMKRDWSDPEIRKKRIESNRFSQDQWIEKFKSVHGDKFDYSKDNYVSVGDKKVTFICREHGEFKTRTHSHIGLKSGGCPKCGQLIRVKSRYPNAQKQFLDKFKSVHGDKYDYSKVVYVKNIEKVIIICPIHGEFLQSPAVHKSGTGCPKCGQLKRLRSQVSQ